MVVNITGLPSGAMALVRITGPESYSRTLNASATLEDLVPGEYVVRIDSIVHSNIKFGVPVIRDTVQVERGVIVTQDIPYHVSSGSLAITILGLPSGIAADVTVVGPDFSATVSESGTVPGLPPGTYSVTARTAGACPGIYQPSTPAAQSVDLSVGATSTATVVYTAGTTDPADFNLTIESVHIVQVTQNARWSVPMVAGRSALVRVFGVANQCNAAKPKVRLTIGDAPPVVIAAPEGSVPYKTGVDALGSTWNYDVPADLVKHDMSIVAEIDYDGVVAEGDESDNRYPSSGSRPVIVKTVPTIGIRFVPITQTVNGEVLTGAVEGNVDAFMDWSRRVHPVANFDVVVREPYTTKASPLSPTDGSTWQLVLGEIDLLRQADMTSMYYRYHYGVAKVSYLSGIAGLGQVPGKAALGWDHLQNGSGSAVMAHELGHNFGRAHSPCGRPNQVDPDYPKTGFYSGGHIGVYGYDQTSRTLKNPKLYTDLMGYCNAQWISDYMYSGILDYLSDPNREPSTSAVSASLMSAAAKQPSLLVWGRIENGVPILEPAFELDAYPEMPLSPGRNQITALDASGSEVLSFSFDGNRIDDLPGDNETFSFVVPLSALRGRTPDILRLSARGRTATNVTSAADGEEPGIEATRPGAGRVRLRWNAARFPVLMVRNRSTGNVIALARGGDATIVANQDEIEINASNRVRSTRQNVRVLR